MKTKNYFLALALAVIFFGVLLFTLSDYGISWDETIHFRRGQAYLYYFLTGKTTFEDLPNLNLQGTEGKPERLPSLRRSLYQNDFHNGEYFLKEDSGHPPINGEIAAFLNYIFFQKLGWMDDISSHHLFNILASTLLVFIVVSFAGEYFGSFAAVVSFLALATYPLFWAESHFNIKDPPEAAFFAAAIWAFIKSLKKGGTFWIVLFWIFLGLALGTKFNILFLPFIIIPFILIRYCKHLRQPVNALTSIPKGYFAALFLGSFIVAIIFFGTWPYLWQNFPENLFNIFSYYKEIGTGYRYQPEGFFVLGFNTFPLQWILFTTPPLVLVLFTAGVISLFINREKNRIIGVLWFLWFIMPVLRVTIPNTTIYGGIRQIMEFLPAMALLSGVGAWQVTHWCKKTRWVLGVRLTIILLFIWPLLVLIRLHPNENIYFNSLIGGLQGAKERNFPSWGNSFGNAYLQGIRWLNQNLEYGAKVALLQGTLANAPLIFFRPDVQYTPSSITEDKKTFFSGINREGEYLMELTFNDTGRDFFYVWEYVDKFLTPVYELKVDNVAILKIWKNDLNHTKREFKLFPTLYRGSISTTKDQNILYIDLEKEALLSSVEVKFDEKESCLPLKTGFIETSLDRINWQKEKDSIPQHQVNRKINLEKGKILYFFAGRNAKYVKLTSDSSQSCVFNNYSVKITLLR